MEFYSHGFNKTLFENYNLLIIMKCLSGWVNCERKNVDYKVCIARE